LSDLRTPAIVNWLALPALCVSVQQGDLEEQDSHQLVYLLYTDKFHPRDIVGPSYLDLCYKGSLRSYLGASESQ
jgi:hypothetical protein